jgi:hypothetical protein
VLVLTQFFLCFLWFCPVAAADAAGIESSHFATIALGTEGSAQSAAGSYFSDHAGRLFQDHAGRLFQMIPVGRMPAAA